MSAIDELCRMLDERGEEWKEHKHVMPGSMVIQRETLWGQPTDVASGKPIPHVYHYRATEMGDGRLFLEAQLMTPEQAIAATLGRGMLTADDVRDLIERHSYASGGNGRDFHNGAYAAIADELNNMLGSCSCTNGERTNAACKPVTYDNGYSVDHLEPGEYHEFWEPACACGNCGELIPMRKFCPNCGCRLEVEA